MNEPMNQENGRVTAEPQDVSVPKQNGRCEVENKIKELLVSQLKVSPAIVAATSSTTPLLGRGVGLDSVETMALVVAIEEEFNVSVPDSDLDAALFASIATLATYVAQKLADGQ